MSRGICLDVYIICLSCKYENCEYNCVLIIDPFGLVVFAVDRVVCRTVSQFLLVFWCLALPPGVEQL